MLKKISIIYFIMNIIILATEKEIPKDYAFNIRKEGRELYSSGSEVNNYIKWQVNSYEEIISKLNKSNLNEENKNKVLKRLFSMYKYNFAKQNSIVNDEIEKYLLIENKTLNTLKQEEEEKKEIVKIINNSSVQSKSELNLIAQKAQKKYPNSYEKQKIYIEAILENYNIYHKK